MSQENVEIVRRTWEAAKRGDPEPAAAAMAPDGEMDLTTGGRMDAEIYLGPDGVRRAYEIWASSWDSMVMEATEFIDVSEDQLIVHFTARGHYTQTGLDLVARDWVYTMRNATVLRVTRALKACSGVRRWRALCGLMWLL
jgi:ketosteroid isomerase-like protein